MANGELGNKDPKELLGTLVPFSYERIRDDTLERAHGDKCQFHFQSDGCGSAGERSASKPLWVSDDPSSGSTVLMSFVTNESANFRQEHV